MPANLSRAACRVVSLLAICTFVLAAATAQAQPSKSSAAAKELGANFGNHPVCAGPFKFVERVQQDRIVLEKFQDYWNEDNVFIDKVTYLPIPDTTVRLANLQSGDLDMGEEMNIAELARRMIRLRGLRPEVDIPIVVTGARPGEKLREILLSAEEHTQPTPHGQVLRVLGLRQPFPRAELERVVDDLLAAAADGNLDEVRRCLWAIARDGSAPPSRAS